MKHYRTIMKSHFGFWAIIFGLFFIFHTRGYAQDYKSLISVDDEKKRLDSYELELEAYLKHYLIDEYPARAQQLWNRDYSSIPAYIRSVQPNVLRWKDVVIKPPMLRKSGEIKRTAYNFEGLAGEWIELPLGNISAKGILVMPKNASKNKPVPLVIVQHGAGSSPERPFTADGKSYYAYAKTLVEAGFAVLSPLNLRDISKRNNIERYTRLANISLPGIEFSRTQNLLDEVLKDDRIDGERIGMWGVSLGGMATMFWMSLDSRIKAGVVSAWFNNRINKMAIEDDKWSNFAKYGEEYAYLTGWLTEFSENDLVSMVCPRPMQIQHGKKDNIAYWPDIIKEFKASKVHYDKLGLANGMELVLHEGGHEAKVAEGLSFLKKHLGKSSN
ncbi:alpha/beta hydrolase family protein [Pseudopedobacter beijingensis]|uniref:Alpha/beta hydrolase family protein n=1 Tax=Pseudopedobacter beijingensis TaxID=1207056 RepID=A0ABW4I6J9_9SPHI